MPAQSLKDMYNSHKTVADRNAIRMTPAPTGKKIFMELHCYSIIIVKHLLLGLHNADLVSGDYNNTSYWFNCILSIGRNFVTQVMVVSAMMNRFALHYQLIDIY